MDQLDPPSEAGPAVVPPTPPAAMPRPTSLPGLALELLLLALIVVGVVFRFSWTNWSQDTDLHPDE